MERNDEQEKVLVSECSLATGYVRNASGVLPVRVIFIRLQLALKGREGVDGRSNFRARPFGYVLRLSGRD